MELIATGDGCDDCYCPKDTSLYSRKSDTFLCEKFWREVLEELVRAARWDKNDAKLCFAR